MLRSEFHLRQREQAQRHRHVMDQREQRADAELPFEPEPDVDRDAAIAASSASDRPSRNSSPETLPETVSTPSVRDSGYSLGSPRAPWCRWLWQRRRCLGAFGQGRRIEMVRCRRIPGRPARHSRARRPSRSSSRSARPRAPEGHPDHLTADEIDARD